MLSLILRMEKPLASNDHRFLNAGVHCFCFMFRMQEAKINSEHVANYTKARFQKTSFKILRVIKKSPAFAKGFFPAIIIFLKNIIPNAYIK